MNKSFKCMSLLTVGLLCFCNVEGMYDYRKADAQKWLNSTYSGRSGFVPVKEDGISAGTLLFKGFVRALQFEIGLEKLGVSEANGSFGPATFRNCPTIQAGSIDTANNFVKLIQHALFCKGYHAGAVTGEYKGKTIDAVLKLKLHALGFDDGDSSVTPLWFKAILNSDAYICVNRGDPQIRSIQQHLNRNYNSYTGIMPCDGHYSRETNRALIFALQAEEGMSVGVANGNFGPGTTEKCPTISAESRVNLVRILQSALYVNGFKGAINGVYDAGTAANVKSFQSFARLPEIGVASMPTIKALLTSCGDTSRPAKACDCSVRLTYPKALALRQNGYECVGRYLTGFVGSGIHRRPKNLTSKELESIFRAGLRVFPIFQDGGWYPEYFADGVTAGERDGRIAVGAAKLINLPLGTIIYFAVDCDLYDYQVSQLIIPYFRGIFSSVCSGGSGYLVGIYGSRNICSRVSDEGYAVSSFVSGMSTGFSGNLGYPLPKHWAFDQFYELKDRRPSGGRDERFVALDGAFDLDKDAYSGRDAGVSGCNSGNGSNSSVAQTIAAMLPGAKFENKIIILPETTCMITPNLSISMSKEMTSTLGFSSSEVGAFYKLTSSYNGKSLSSPKMSFGTSFNGFGTTLSSSSVGLGTFFNGFNTSFTLLPPENGFKLTDIIKGIALGGGNPSNVVENLAARGGVGISATRSIGDKFSISIGGKVKPEKASIDIKVTQKLKKKELFKNYMNEGMKISGNADVVKTDNFSIEGHPFKVMYEMAMICDSAVEVANGLTPILWELKIADLKDSMSQFSEKSTSFRQELRNAFESLRSIATSLCDISSMETATEITTTGLLLVLIAMLLSVVVV